MREKLTATICLVAVAVATSSFAGTESFNPNGTWDVKIKCKGNENGVTVKAKLTGTLEVLDSFDDGSTTVRVNASSDAGPLEVLACGVSPDAAGKPGKGHIVFAAGNGTTYVGGDLAAQTYQVDPEGISGKVKGTFSLGTATDHLRCKLKGKRTSTTPPALFSCSPA
ncbi:MAG TPA: hypothetical protein VEL28_22365 [Candidatus Binatia bacterium]|nr:hypothetical protein [Candidatus Binatia bacterium]